MTTNTVIIRDIRDYAHHASYRVHKVWIRWKQQFTYILLVYMLLSKQIYLWSRTRSRNQYHHTVPKRIWKGTESRHSRLLFFSSTFDATGIWRVIGNRFGYYSHWSWKLQLAGIISQIPVSWDDVISNRIWSHWRFRLKPDHSNQLKSRKNIRSPPVLMWPSAPGSSSSPMELRRTVLTRTDFARASTTLSL